MNYKLREELDERSAFLKKVIAEKTKALKNVPPGMLRCSRCGNKVQYYQRMDAKDSNGKYIKASNQKLARALAQKDYDQRVLHQAQQELKLVDRLKEHYLEKTPEDLYTSLHESRQNLVMPIELPDEMYAKDWQEQEFVGKPVGVGVPEYYTNKGEHVRSKTEIFIANSLARMDVPYRYEAPLYLSGLGTIHPDFTVLNIRTRKEYYWEHMGRMDDSVYVVDAVNRIAAYENNGYYPGERLLLTYETSVDPIHTKQIEAMIRHFLL